MSLPDRPRRSLVVQRAEPYAEALAADAPLVELLERNAPYLGYAYAYPHKTAYRELEPPVPLQEAWAGEDLAALSLYVHVPFCEFRCGFCNLFTERSHELARFERYLTQVEVQAEVTAEALGQGASFGQLALGGGTPTILPAPQLDRLLTNLKRRFGVEAGALPSSVEASPATLDEARIAVLKAHGVERVSLGVQSFAAETRAGFGRPSSDEEITRALTQLSDAEFPIVNIDLIYGAGGQRAAELERDIDRALEFSPAQVFLYPLYTRPETGNARRVEHADRRLELYRAGRARLLRAGYRQHSMRMFQRAELQPRASAYRCQDDGMVGLGCGARSYTSSLHYASRFAVRSAGVSAILKDWLSQTRADLGLITHGFRLDADEQRRRRLIQSVLNVEGLEGNTADPEILALESQGLVTRGERVRLSERGLELSDLIGPWLYSSRVRRLSAAWAAR